MNLKSLGTSALLALAGAVALVPSTSMAALSYSDGDLLLGIRALGGQGSTSDYLVNLGSISQYLTANTNDTILTLDTEISNTTVASDLSTLFGSNWASRSDLVFSITGTKFSAGLTLPNRTMFASRASTPGAHTSLPWDQGSVNTYNPVVGRLQAEGIRFGQGTDINGTQNPQTESGAFSLIQATAGSNSHASYQPGGTATNAPGNIAYGYFADPLGVENAINSANDLYVMRPSTAPEVIGQFTIAPNATVTFTPDGVPEPSTFTAIAGGVALLGVLRRRKTAR